MAPPREKEVALALYAARDAEWSRSVEVIEVLRAYPKLADYLPSESRPDIRKTPWYLLVLIAAMLTAIWCMYPWQLKNLLFGNRLVAETNLLEKPEALDAALFDLSDRESIKQLNQLIRDAQWDTALRLMCDLVSIQSDKPRRASPLQTGLLPQNFTHTALAIAVQSASFGDPKRSDWNSEHTKRALELYAVFAKDPRKYSMNTGAEYCHILTKFMEQGGKNISKPANENVRKAARIFLGDIDAKRGRFGKQLSQYESNLKLIEGFTLARSLWKTDRTVSNPFDKNDRINQSEWKRLYSIVLSYWIQDSDPVPKGADEKMLCLFFYVRAEHFSGNFFSQNENLVVGEVQLKEDDVEKRIKKLK